MELLTASWRIYPALALAVAGLACLAQALHREWAELRRPVTDPRKALALARWLRTTILGLALVAVGAGWLWQHAAVVGVALVILAEEMLEISVVVAALRAAPGIRTRPETHVSGRSRTRVWTGSTTRDRRAAAGEASAA